jgi:hypothetical protein
MNPQLPSTLGRLGQRLISGACALLTASLLAAFVAPTARADVVFTRSTATGESWALYSVAFTPTYSGNSTLAFNVTAHPANEDDSIFIDAVKVTNTATTFPSIGLKVTFVDACRHPLIRA